ncbi:hypothetical protein B0O99DRAFT_626048 [Bisporella sp. PMI_857]|nr:hypothetical protein B0O99DRAFT_626048 [Bisporella sp. PMI_857]
MDNDFKDCSTFQGNESDTDDTTQLIDAFQVSNKRHWRVQTNVISLVAGTLWLMGAIVLFITRCLKAPSDIHSECVNPQVLYSPAQEAVRYRPVWFTDGVYDKTKYMGSSPEVDEAWRNEYSFGLVRITKDQASKLPSQTSQIPGDTDHYIVGLEVFHQLHCLNAIRKALDPEYYNITLDSMAPDDRSEQRAHLDHCLELLRQATMCHSDISLNVFTWVPFKQKTLPHSESWHSCRDFEAIKQWSHKHQLLAGLDEGQHMELSPPNEHTVNGFSS